MTDEGSQEKNQDTEAQEPRLELPADQLEEPRRTKAQEIAAILDEPTMKFVDWENLMGEGVVVRLHIKRVRFRKKLRFEDLGIHFSDPVTKKTMEGIFRLGMKNLLPLSYIGRLERIETNARKLLTGRSIETVWGPFIPVTAYKGWSKANEEYRLEYYRIRDDILQNYKTITKQVIKDYTDAARNAYRILHKLDQDALTEREREREIFYLAGFRHRIRKVLPSLEEIQNTFEYVYSPTYIDLPILTKLAEEGPLPPTKRVIEGVTPEEQLELRYRQESAQERQKMMKAMNEDVVQKAQEQKEQLIDSFLTTVITHVRGLLYDATTNVLASLKKNENLQPRSVVQLKHLVEQLQSLNFYRDRDVERTMRIIESLIEKPHEDRDLDLIEQRLREIGTVMRASLLSLEYEFREDRMDAEESRERERALLDLEKRELAGIARRPSAKEVREARMSLDLTLPVWDESREERMDEGSLQSMRLVEDEREERVWS